MKAKGIRGVASRITLVLLVAALGLMPQKDHAISEESPGLFSNAVAHVEEAIATFTIVPHPGRQEKTGFESMFVFDPCSARSIEVPIETYLESFNTPVHVPCVEFFVDQSGLASRDPWRREGELESAGTHDDAEPLLQGLRHSSWNWGEKP